MLATSTDDWASTEESPTTLTRIEPFADLPVAVFAAIDEISVLRSYGAGETIFAMGQYDGSEILLVRTGAIRASYADYQTGAMLFEEFVAGQCYNLARAVVGGEDPRFAQLTLSASEETELVSIDANETGKQANAKAIAAHDAAIQIGLVAMAKKQQLNFLNLTIVIR